MVDPRLRESLLQCKSAAALRTIAVAWGMRPSTRQRVKWPLQYRVLQTFPGPLTQLRAAPGEGT